MVLLPRYTKENFSSNAYYAPDEIENIKLITPSSGIITAKRGENIHFKFNYKRQFDRLQINSNTYQNPPVWTWQEMGRRKRARVLDTFAIKKQQYIKYRRVDDICEFDYLVKDNTLDYLEILFDYRRVMRFKVHINR